MSVSFIGWKANGNDEVQRAGVGEKRVVVVSKIVRRVAGEPVAVPEAEYVAMSKLRDDVVRQAEIIGRPRCPSW